MISSCLSQFSARRMNKKAYINTYLKIAHLYALIIIIITKSFQYSIIWIFVSFYIYILSPRYLSQEAII